MNHFIGIGSRSPNVTRPEVRVVGLRIADIVDNLQVSLFPEGLQRHHLIGQSVLVTQSPQATFLYGDGGPYLVVSVIAPQDEGVEPVIAAFESDKQQYAVIAGIRVEGTQQGGRCESLQTVPCQSESRAQGCEACQLHEIAPAENAVCVLVSLRIV